MLLIVAVLGSSLFIYNVLSLNIQKKAFIALSACAQQHRDSISALQQCLAPFTRIQTAWEIGGVVLVLAIAAAIYWISRAFMLRRRTLVPLSIDDAPEVVTFLTTLCREAGLILFHQRKGMIAQEDWSNGPIGWHHNLSSPS